MTNDERLAALRDELTLRECGIDVPERHGSPAPGAAERDDLAERRVNGQWQFWGWDDRFNADTIRQDYLDGPNVWPKTDFLDETGH